MFRLLLYPFAVLFRIATGIRNHLYSIGHKRSIKFEVPVISVGNLSLGGSGKTPTIEYLIRLLKNDEKIATLSRGYGRRTKGLRFATETDSAQTLGDEPFQFYKNHSNYIKVVVGEDRAFAIPNILHEFGDTSVILLDDAYQHRSVKPHLNILLTDYSTPFYEDYLVPMGRLREGRVGARRADIIVITKCPVDLSTESQNQIKEKVTRYSGHKPIFFSYIQYGAPKSFNSKGMPLSSKVVLVSGISKAKPLYRFVNENFELLKHLRFRDHHWYTKRELLNVRNFIETQSENVSLITTEKDMVRLMDSRFDGILEHLSCFYLPIEMCFLNNGAEFDALVKSEIEKVKSNSISGDE